MPPVSTALLYTAGVTSSDWSWVTLKRSQDGKGNFFLAKHRTLEPLGREKLRKRCPIRFLNIRFHK